METVVYTNNTKSKSLRGVKIRSDAHSVQATPKERLHTVEEFINKLEQAVLERL